MSPSPGNWSAGMQAGNPEQRGSAADLEQHVRGVIEGLSYLPTTASVALRFIELGRNPDAEPDDYARIIESDSSLSTKMLALSNSSWFGVRNKVTRVKSAVNLLGIATVRTLALSFCAAGLHNELDLGPDESGMFWAAGLAKAIAAREYMRLKSPEMCDEAFAAGLFQDFAVPVMYAVAPVAMLRLLGNTALTATERIAAEREIFHLDHAEFGRIIGQRLELPSLYVDAVAFHHQFDSLSEFMPNAALAEAIYLASMFPHTLDSGSPADAALINEFVGARLKIEPQEFLERVQAEFNSTYQFFCSASDAEIPLARILSEASAEMADRVSELIGTVQHLMQQMGVLADQGQRSADTSRSVAPPTPPARMSTAAGGDPFPGVSAGQRATTSGAMSSEVTFDAATGEAISDQAQDYDPTTHLLLPRAFVPRANRLIEAAVRRQLSVAVGIFSVDHDIVDETDDPSVLCLARLLKDELTGPSHVLTRASRGSLAFVAVGRLPEDLRNHVEAIVCRLPVESPPLSTPLKRSGAARSRSTTASAGVVWYTPGGAIAGSVNPLIMQARHQLDEARKAGGACVSWCRPSEPDCHPERQRPSDLPTPPQRLSA